MPHSLPLEIQCQIWEYVCGREVLHIKESSRLPDFWNTICKSTMTEGNAEQTYVKDETDPPLCMNGTVAAIISRLNTFVSVSFGPVDLFTFSFGPSLTNGIYFTLIALLFFEILLGGIVDVEIRAWNTFLQSIYVLHMEPGCRRNLSNYRSEVEWARVLRVLSKTFVLLFGLNITLELPTFSEHFPLVFCPVSSVSQSARSMAEGIWVVSHGRRIQLGYTILDRILRIIRPSWMGRVHGEKATGMIG